MEFVYVYWTDTLGKHYSISGQHALNKYGAKQGKTHWEARSYGIPVYNSQQSPMPESNIKMHIKEFLTLATKYTNTMFIVPSCKIKPVALSLLFAPNNVICHPEIFALLKEEEIP